MTERNVPASVMAELERAESPDALLWFLTITHRDIGEPIRIVSDVFDYVLGGETYVAMPFDGRPLTDNDQMPAAELVISNVDRRVGFALERSTERAIIDLAVYSSADFDLSVEPRTEIGTASRVYGFGRFELSDVEVSVTQIRGRVTLPDYTQEPWPYMRATQDRFPGLFV
jgi:hypothetical protein